MVNMMVAHPDDSILFGACSDGALRMWNLDTKEELCPLINTGSEPRTKKSTARLLKKGLSNLRCVEFNPDSLEVISGDDAGLATLWSCSDLSESVVISSCRVSELGVMDIAYYGKPSRYIALIKEGRLLLLESLRSKIRHTSIFIVPNPEPPRLCKSLHVLNSGQILLAWTGAEEKTVHLLNVVNTSPYKTVASLPAQPLQHFIPAPVSYPPRFYYVSAQQIYAYCIADSKSTSVVPIGGEDVLNFMLRPMDRPVQALVILESGIVLHDIERSLKKSIEGYTAVFVGGDMEVSRTLVVLCEDRVSVSIYDINTEAHQVVILSAKVKNLFWSGNLYGVTYETVYEHSLRLSCGFTSKKLVEANMDLSYRLEYDENLVLVKWNINGEVLALATTKRICVLNSSLVLLRNYPIFERPLSLYWFGNTLIFSSSQGIYYCGDTVKLIFHTINESLLCGVLDDRIYVISEGIIKAFPCNMIEPLLWGCLEAELDKSKIDAIARLMATPCISEEIIKKTLKKGFAEAAWHLAEKTLISTELKLSILKELNNFEEIEKILLRGKDITDPIEYRHFLEELHSDHNWKPERMLIPQVAVFFDSRGQLQKEANFLKISKDYWGLSLLHLSVGNNYPLTEEAQDQEPLLEDAQVVPAQMIAPLNLGYGELAYRQLVDNQDILAAYSDNLAQWFGWDALKPPEKFAPQFMGHEIKPQNESAEEEREVDEAEAIWVYLRCDEGKGEGITDVVGGKVVRISEEQWGEVLEEGEPLDFDDKWGKQAQPSYRILLSPESFIILDEIKLEKTWSLEFWVNIADRNVTIVTVGSLSLQVRHKKLCCVNGDSDILMQECEDNRKVKRSEWEHICISFREPNLNVYLGTNLVYSGNFGKLQINNTITIGGFSGMITEIRLWKTCRKIELIKENYKCPLEILSEKRKKKWLNIKINKNEKNISEVAPVANKIEFRLPMPDSRARVELKPPSAGGFARRLAPPGNAGPALLNKPKVSKEEDSNLFPKKSVDGEPKNIENAEEEKD